MGCSTGGCGTEKNGIPAGCNNNGSCGTEDGCNKLTVFDWLGNMNLPEGQSQFDIVEVRFKNSRKEFFRNLNNLTLSVGEVIAVEASPGHDIGTVSLTGELVKLQLKKRNVNFDSEEIRKIYRKAKQSDIDKWKEAQSLEVNTMFRARTIALKLGLEMKLSDVEFQGDKSKAIFYYTADARVDFRELIKVLADEFKVRVEMRQIGARQEAARLGGIGACGRELCCSTWLTDFRTVSTSAARYQQLSLNPLKLAGQCGKLKCCLNYELDSYIDALKEFPDMDGKKLLTKKGEAFLQKTDIFRRMMWFSYRHDPGVFIPLNVKTVHSVLEANAKGDLPDDIKSAIVTEALAKSIEQPVFENVVGQDSLTRFDKKPKPKNNNNKPRHNNKPNQNPNQKTQANLNQKPQNNPNPNQKPKMQGGPNDKPNNNPNNKNNNPNRNQNNPNRKFNKPNNDNKDTPKNDPPKKDV
ncbi:MAG: regulatory iron-sulfur-containing complex subunit RicT [Bacteroidia bacterium]